MNSRVLISLSFAFLLLFSCTTNDEKKYESWGVYGGNKENNHYSSLKQVDTANVAQLQVAWEYHSNDSEAMTQIQVNPVVINNVLYGVSAKLKLFALDAANGKELWVFDPVAEAMTSGDSSAYFSFNACRGVAYYSDGKDDKRIFYTAGAKLFCINAANGKPIVSFANNGKLDLHKDLGRDVSLLSVTSTTPGIIYKDMLIIGTRVDEDMPAAPGHIRAYDVHTGKLRWIFHTIPQPGEPGYETWGDKDAYLHVGGANSWAGFSMDEEKGIVFAPIGSAVYDFYGGKRPGANLYANSLLALDANTGKRIWHFQTVHHDIWDRDLPTAPALVTITKDGKKTEAVAQPTKSGFVFLFDRATGKPIYPVEEKPVPTETELTGETPNPTQPFPSLPKPFVRQSMTEKDLNTLVPDSSYQDIKKKLESYKTGFIFNTPSKEGTVIFPGYDGGAEWGGPGYDPETGIIYINASEMPWVLTMVDVKNEPAAKENNLQAGKRLYSSTCARCHGPERKGGGNYPALTDVNKKYNEEQFTALVSAGRRMMPSFNQLSASEKKALASFILDIKSEQSAKFIAPVKHPDPWSEMPYTGTGYNKFYTKEGYPAVAPPWGTLNAINLSTGDLVWKDTLGDYPELKAKGIHSGTENYGGPAITAGGLLFIAATSDSKMRAFNKRTGELLWEVDLPACGFATPSVYAVNGKQFLVIACGGGKLGKPSGDAYVAFALPATK
ncbi:MAG TPA: PQQ-binding-like beta-propeller repeat protein [Panacibacter sp.]|nr:PQQ-binding-like beta-propeller repeat protein [Panacibacter sp.]HNP45204.1 PQQ-binding-like beta-propeller repeat protein [Panacibacter sp.]